MRALALIAERLRQQERMYPLAQLQRAPLCTPPVKHTGRHASLGNGHIRCLGHKQLNGLKIIGQQALSGWLVDTEGKVLALCDVDVPRDATGQALQHHDAVRQSPPAATGASGLCVCHMKYGHHESRVQASQPSADRSRTYGMR